MAETERETRAQAGQRWLQAMVETVLADAKKQAESASTRAMAVSPRSRARPSHHVAPTSFKKPGCFRRGAKVGSTRSQARDRLLGTSTKGESSSTALS